MKEILNNIRMPKENISLKKKVCITVCMVLCGLLLGVFQKWLDGVACNDLPIWVQWLDVGNYFGRLTFWILISVVISIYAENPLRASINTFSFLISMIIGYYVYCKVVMGFLPVSYMMVWIVIALGSIVCAYICWYARGDGVFSILLSALIIGVLFSQAFLILDAIKMTHLLDAVTWGIGIIVLHRKHKEFMIEIILSLCFAVVYQTLFPYFG